MLKAIMVACVAVILTGCCGMKGGCNSANKPKGDCGCSVVAPK